jgi:hypothetical protein
MMEQKIDDQQARIDRLEKLVLELSIQVQTLQSIKIHFTPNSTSTSEDFSTASTFGIPFSAPAERNFSLFGNKSLTPGAIPNPSPLFGSLSPGAPQTLFGERISTLLVNPDQKPGQSLFLSPAPSSTLFGTSTSYLSEHGLFGNSPSSKIHHWDWEKMIQTNLLEVKEDIEFLNKKIYFLDFRFYISYLSTFIDFNS